MDILKLITNQDLNGVHLGMTLSSFKANDLYKTVTDTIFLCEETELDEFIYKTLYGIEITFTFNKITSISIDPNYEDIMLGKLRINRNLALQDLISSYYSNDIAWTFNSREEHHECEIITYSGVSVIFHFDEDEFWISKFRLNNKFI